MIRTSLRSALAAGLTLVATAALAAAPAAAETPEYLGAIGSPEPGSTQLRTPWGVATGADGRVYVTQFDSGNVAVFDSAGARVGTIGRYGTGVDELRQPSAIAVGPTGVYVADRLNERVVRYRADGSFLGYVGAGPGSGNGQFKLPTGVTLRGNEVLVASQYRFQRFNAQNGAFIDGRGGAGTGPGQFEGVAGIGTDSQGRVYVSETQNDRVQRFAPGPFVPELMWGTTGSGDGQFRAPQALAVDRQTDGIWVTDQGTGQVQQFGAGGQIRDRFGSTTGEGALRSPVGIAVDCRGTLYIADSLANRVQRFGAKPATVPGNLLRNPGFDESAATCGTTRPATGAGPGWSGSPTASATHYGAAGAFPARQVGDARQGGTTLLASTPTDRTEIDQVVDVSSQALDIDDGRRLVRLSALLGGAGTDEDSALVEALPQDASGAPIGAPLRLAPVTAADRGNQTTLIPREAATTLPAGTRTIRVRVTLNRVSGPTNDATADNVALTLTPQRPPADRTAPRVTFTAPSAAKLARKGSVTLVAGCDERCELDATATGLGRTLGAVETRAASGQRRVVLRLSGKGLKALRKAVRGGQTVAVTLRVVGTDAAGNRGTATLTARVGR